MGCYVNPEDQVSKFAWLLDHGEFMDGPCDITESHLPVAYLNNGPFTAAGICYSQNEIKAFSDPNDIRFKMWFKVSREALRLVSDLEHYER